MNGSDECNSLINNVKWTDPTSLLVLAILLVINVMVVVGNCLVIAAVYISSKLRTVTNLFIVSLAVADLMVGVAVLPFSATWEVFKVWIFGDLWCSIWLAVDVWMCTASILNLCAISLDRYVAVTRPVNYPSIMSSSRAKILIAGVWILSFVICFPPLVGWKDSKLSNDSYGEVSAPYSGSGTVRIRGSHTVVTNALFPSETDKSRILNLTDDSDSVVFDVDNKNVISYHTNYSEHFLTRNPTVSDLNNEEKIYRPYVNYKDFAKKASSKNKLEYTSFKNEVVPNQTEEPIDYQEETNSVKSQIHQYHRNVTHDEKIRHLKIKKLKTELEEVDEDQTPENLRFHSLVDRLSKRSIENEPKLSNQIASYSGVPVVSVDNLNYPGQSNENVHRITEISASSSATSLLPVSTVSSSLPSHSSSSFSSQCPWTCELTSDTGYVIYSALGSFFIPMAVMLFFYWRIYRAAVQTTRAINQGFRTTKGSGAFGNRFDEQRLTLRIHRGRGSVQNHSICSSNTNSTNGGNSSVSASPSTNSTFGKSPEVQRLNRTRSSRDPKPHEKIKISVSYPSSDQISSTVMNNNGIPRPPSPNPSSRMSTSSVLSSSPTPTESKNFLSTPAGTRRTSLSSPKKTTFSTSPPKKNFLQNHVSPKRFSSSSKEVVYSVHYTNKNGKESTTTSVYRGRDPNSYLRVTGARLAASHNRRSGHRSLSIDSTNSSYDDEASMSRRNSTRSQCIEDGNKELSSSPTFDDNNAQKPKLISKMGKRNIKAQVKRFRMETKAAKTLGIIVGGFILCWMPFFTIYLIRAFCPDCINPIVFSILFWLGYCNSAINPCIYALFSKDFRFAFKKIICRCLCGQEKQTTINLKRRGSDGSQLKTPTHDRQRSPSYNPPNFATPNSVGEDSDPGGSESR